MTFVPHYSSLGAKFSENDHGWFLLLFSGFVISCILMLSDVWIGVWNDWTQLGSYEHGIALAAMTIALIVRFSRDVSLRSRSHGHVGFIMTILCAIIFMAFAASLLKQLSIELLSYLLLPLIFTAGMLLFIDLRNNRRTLLATPLFLYFGIPIWDQFSSMLQSITITAVSVLIDWLGVVAFIDGTSVQLPQGTFEIAQGCSGLRFFLTGTALTIFWASYSEISLRKGGMALGIVIIVTLITNWIRVTAIVVSGYMFGMDTTIVESHYYFGWILNLTVLMLLWSTANRVGYFDRKDVASIELRANRVD